MLFCMIPLLVTGYTMTIHTSWHSSAEVSAPYAEIQTCEKGLGAHAKASTANLYAVGAHYGFSWEPVRDVSVTVQPKLGLGYANTIHPVSQSRNIARFEVGLSAMMGYGRTRVGLEYWHLSNGSGWNGRNIGLDLVGMNVGLVF